MQDATVTSLYSNDFHRLQNLFKSFPQPCGLQEILEFNRLYGRIYPQLTAQEKRRTEAWVDDLIAHLEDKELASRIYGVV